MSAIQPPTPNHQGETFGAGETQFFDCEALSADHPEIQARERARQQRLQSLNPTEKEVRPAPEGNKKGHLE
jgi:hypothetical protein